MGKALKNLCRKSLAQVIVAAAMLAACASTAVAGDRIPPDRTYELKTFSMGTVIDQKVTGSAAQAAAEEAAAKMRSLEELLTFREPTGDVYKINQNAGIKSVELSPVTIKIIKKSIQVAELSNGAFDITVGPLVRLWSAAAKEKRVPTQEALSQAMSLVDYRDIVIDGRSGKLRRAGQTMDLGGIAKGYAGDAAIQIYRKHGIQSGFINIGGNVVTLGSRPDGSPWKIGIRNPRPKGNSDQAEEILGYVTVRDKAVSAAGDDQRYFEKDGIRYGHILDPKTGYPAKTDLLSVTLIAASSFDADAFDTAVFILGLEKGRELLRRLGTMEAVFITSDKKIHVTDGLKDNFIFHGDNSGFQYVR